MPGVSGNLSSLGWANKPIAMHGRNSATGTHGYFKEQVLKSGDYKDEVNEELGSRAVVENVGANPYSIGYAGIGYATNGVRAVPLAASEDGRAVEPTRENAYARVYPLMQVLYIHVNKTPNKPLDPRIREFMRFVLSRDGPLVRHRRSSCEADPEHGS